MVQTSAGIVGQQAQRSISYESPCAIGDSLGALSPAAIASITWVTNLGLFVPFQNLYRATGFEWSWQNGTGTGGNVDCGLYDLAGNRLTSLGSTSRGTASGVITSSTFTDYVLNPGWYYLAFSCDSAALFNGSALTAGLYQALGVAQVASAFPLPSTVTLAVPTNAFLPLVNLTLQNVTIT